MIMKNKIILAVIFMVKTIIVFAQKDSLNPWKNTAYGELYYSFDFAEPQNNEKPNFIYNHKRHNEVNLNLAFIKASYNTSNIRVNAALMTGNYAQYNLSSEPTWAQFIYEANLGVKLSKTKNIWFDAGIMPSHIGFESAISADCWTLTRSILAENSPYYETGIKLNYGSKNEKFNFNFLVLNGWQKIQKPIAIQKPSFGIQLNYKASEKLFFNYSNFIGSDKPDSLKSIRIFHNMYLQYEPTQKFGVIAGFDIGTEKSTNTDLHSWYSPVIILRYAISDKMKIALRGEYYNDKNQVIIITNTLNGFQVAGISSNIDYKINDKVLLRIEGKYYNSKDLIFEYSKAENYSVSTSMSVKF